MRIWCGPAAIAGLIALLSAACAEKDKDRKVSEDKLPKAVDTAIQERFPDAKLTSFDKQKDKGKVVYEIKLNHKDRKYEMDIFEDGTFDEIKKEIYAKDIPKSVAKAAKEKHPDATIEIAWEINIIEDNKQKAVHYEVVLQTADKQKVDLEVPLDGKADK
jgi:hypothetical protein